LLLGLGSKNQPPRFSRGKRSSASGKAYSTWVTSSKLSSSLPYGRASRRYTRFSKDMKPMQVYLGAKE
jgi:hypothetical protein